MKEVPGGYCEIGVDSIGDTSGSSIISHDSRSSDGSELCDLSFSFSFSFPLLPKSLREMKLSPVGDLFPGLPGREKIWSGREIWEVEKVGDEGDDERCLCFDEVTPLLPEKRCNFFLKGLSLCVALVALSCVAANEDEDSAEALGLDGVDTGTGLSAESSPLGLRVAEGARVSWEREAPRVRMEMAGVAVAVPPLSTCRWFSRLTRSSRENPMTLSRSHSLASGPASSLETRSRSASEASSDPESYSASVLKRTSGCSE